MSVINGEQYKIMEKYFNILQEMKENNIIRTHNLVGDWGELLAIKHYNENPAFPNLEIARVGVKHIDAINKNYERYSIKTTTTKTTGVFTGLNEPYSDMPEEQKFEYVIIVILNKDMSLREMYELDWQTFLSIKRWNRNKKAWFLSVTKELKSKAKRIY